MQHGDKKDAESRTRGGKSTMGLNKKMTKGTLGNESAEEEEEGQDKPKGPMPGDPEGESAF